MKYNVFLMVMMLGFLKSFLLRHGILKAVGQTRTGHIITREQLSQFIARSTTTRHNLTSQRPFVSTQNTSQVHSTNEYYNMTISSYNRHSLTTSIERGASPPPKLPPPRNSVLIGGEEVHYATISGTDKHSLTTSIERGASPPPKLPPPRNSVLIGGEESNYIRPVRQSLIIDEGANAMSPVVKKKEHIYDNPNNIIKKSIAPVRQNSVHLPSNHNSILETSIAPNNIYNNFDDITIRYTFTKKALILILGSTGLIIGTTLASVFLGFELQKEIRTW